MPRPTPDDPELLARLRAGASAGMTYKLLARAIGIAESTFHDWQRRGRQGLAPWSVFVAELDAAEAEGARRLLEVIRDAATSGQWQAAAWILERRHEYRRDAPPVIVPDAPGVATRAEAVESLKRLPTDLLREALAE